MIVAFETEKLRKICEDPDVAENGLGATAATFLRARLADIRASSTTDDLIVGNPRFEGSAEEYLVIDLGGRGLMVWTPNHVTPKTDADGHTEWTRVTRIRLLRLEIHQ
jgi:hypothetical protein